MDREREEKYTFPFIKKRLNMILFYIYFISIFLSNTNGIPHHRITKTSTIPTTSTVTQDNFQFLIDLLDLTTTTDISYEDSTTTTVDISYDDSLTTTTTADIGDDDSLTTTTDIGYDDLTTRIFSSTTTIEIDDQSNENENENEMDSTTTIIADISYDDDLTPTFSISDSSTIESEETTRESLIIDI
jgi:hypothetical protein